MYYPDDEDSGKWHSSKNTKRWCKGKVGREHVPVITRNKFSLNTECRMIVTKYWNGNERNWWHCHHEITCENCGKMLHFSAEKMGGCPDKP